MAAFDEQATIEACVRRILSVFPRGCEVLVVDGGSDRTGEIVRALEPELDGLRYVRNEGDRGKGHAIRTGIAAARAGVMAQIDADLQFLPEELPRLVAPILDGRAQVTLGTRFAAGSVRRRGATPLARRAGNALVAAYTSVLVGRRLTDVLAGMKAWTREAADAMALESDGYVYEVEIPAKALQRGLRLVEVPITTDARQGGHTHVHVALDGLALLADVTRLFLRLRRESA